MRRGFKALAERNAAEARQALGLAITAPLDPWVFAKHLRVHVMDFSDIELAANIVQQLTVVDGDSWSAMTLAEDGMHVIVVNPSHAQTRQRNDLMHELSHIQLGHAPARVDVSKTGLLLLSDYSEEQEQEADWHAAAMLLPRDGLIQLRAKQSSTSDIASFYGVSEALCEWRLRMTGVDVQMRRSRFR